MKSEITNELIKRIYANAGTPIRKELEKEVPELFKPKFKVGDWIISPHYFHRVGFDENGNKDEDERGAYTAEYYNSFNNDYRLATPKEVEDHLIKIAEEKGWIKGAKMNTSAGESFAREHSEVNGIGFEYDPLSDAFRVYVNGDFFTKRLIYINGKWATIIKEESPIEIKFKDALSDIAKLKGVDVSRIRIVD